MEKKEGKKEMVSMMEENRVFQPAEEYKKVGYVKSMEEYKALYKRSIDDPDGFWREQAKDLDWFKPFDKVSECDFNKPEVKWFLGGKLNISYNCLDRHLATRGNKAALIWQGEPLEESKTYTYQQLHYQVSKFANVLKKHGIKKGDRVSIYLPMIPELPIAMLACARIGAIHSVVFGGFSAEALRDRIQDCEAKILITCDGYYRSGKTVQSKGGADQALKDCPSIKEVVVVKRMGIDIPFTAGRDIWWHEEMAKPDISPDCKPEPMDSEDLLFILYTSGSTGKPKGVMHTTAGYLLYAMETVKYVFDIKDKDVWFCTADIGWVTGHSYVVYGPLAMGATSVMFEGVPTFPQPDRFWEIVERHRVNQFYTAPTAVRALMKEGEKWTTTRDMSSLRVLGSVGEPINPEAWIWYYKNVGKEKCPIMDTWWQTETGGFLITPLPITPLKPGSATFPFFGVVPKILRENGSECEADEGGSLVISRGWPGMLRGFYNDAGNKRFKDTYFSIFPGQYFSGDGARRDPDGYYWLMGRIDDVINVSGHRIGTAEVESALVSHSSVAEAAVIGYPHEIKGQGIYAFVTVKTGIEKSDKLKKDLVAHVRTVIGPIASPDKLQFADGLPKTRSGKIMRRILRKIAENKIDELGDTSTLADPSVVTQLVEERQ
jgi:acetyl-CoA synthetase